ncbi:MAG TPA: hypothetical protein PLT82_10855 [Candidatus Hydrogenedens sp.]|nr:hypothetical protein [Candidatus Hydrogenedens sp.]HOL21208.1 hypothetical protein [Candidatus Hydrogenedens sp.]HPP59621.1 hypothetical protein [Candidatus Hydrogenedens sp.]
MKNKVLRQFNLKKNIDIPNNFEKIMSYKLPWATPAREGLYVGADLCVYPEE